jgi:hypothetical protein
MQILLAFLTIRLYTEVVFDQQHTLRRNNNELVQEPQDQSEIAQ